MDKGPESVVWYRKALWVCLHFGYASVSIPVPKGAPLKPEQHKVYDFAKAAPWRTERF